MGIKHTLRVCSPHHRSGRSAYFHRCTYVFKYSLLSSFAPSALMLHTQHEVCVRVSETERNEDPCPHVSTQAAGASPAATLRRRRAGRSVPLPRGRWLRFPSPLLGVCWEPVPRVVRQSRALESCVGTETSNEGFFLPRECCAFSPAWRQSLTQPASHGTRDSPPR